MWGQIRVLGSPDELCWAQAILPQRTRQLAVRASVECRAVREQDFPTDIRVLYSIRQKRGGWPDRLTGRPVPNSPTKSTNQHVVTSPLVQKVSAHTYRQCDCSAVVPCDRTWNCQTPRWPQRTRQLDQRAESLWSNQDSLRWVLYCEATPVPSPSVTGHPSDHSDHLHNDRQTETYKLVIAEQTYWRRSYQPISGGVNTVKENRTMCTHNG